MSVKKSNAHVNAVIAMIVNVTVRIAIVMKLVIVVAKMDILANARNKVELRDIAESGRYKDANFMSIRVNDFADENKAI